MHYVVRVVLTVQRFEVRIRYCQLYIYMHSVWVVWLSQCRAGSAYVPYVRGRLRLRGVRIQVRPIEDWIQCSSQRIPYPQ